MISRFLPAVSSCLLIVSGLVGGQSWAAPSYERHQGPSQNTPAGQARNGFALSLSADAYDVANGSPIWVTVEVRNISGQIGYANFGSRSSGYDFSIVKQGDHRILSRNPRSSFGLDVVGGSIRGRAIPPNTSNYLHFRLDDLYLFDGPGTYDVRVERARIRIDGKQVVLPFSNTITITVSS